MSVRYCFAQLTVTLQRGLDLVEGGEAQRIPGRLTGIDSKVANDLGILIWADKRALTRVDLLKISELPRLFSNRHRNNF